MPQQTLKPWWDQPISQDYGHNGEHGIDIPIGYHSPLTSPLGGVVSSAGYHPWAGEVDISTILPNGQQVVEYIMHLSDIAPGIVPGAVISPGELIGYSGGQIGYGDHPTGPPYSTGPHVEIGFQENGQFINPHSVLPSIDAASPSQLQTLAQQAAGLFAGGTVPSGDKVPGSNNTGTTTGTTGTTGTGTTLSTTGTSISEPWTQAISDLATGQFLTNWFTNLAHAPWLVNLAADATFGIGGWLLIIIGLLVFFFAGNVRGQTPAAHTAHAVKAAGDIAAVAG